jgi:hypothetical protein
MHVRWFGEPWPSADERAPICDDDAYRIDAPDVLCISCDEQVVPGDRGVVTWAGEGVGDERHALEIDTGPLTYRAVAYHVDCWFEGVMGPNFREDLGIEIERHP